MVKIGLIIGILMITGCSSVVKTNDLLITNATKTPVNITAITSGKWFDSAVHKVEDISIKHDDGVTTRGLHLLTKNSKYIVIYFGGNSFRIQDAGIGLTRRFAQLGVDFLWMDYRGIGASDGTPSIENLKQDALSINEFAKKYGKKIILHGVSMGSLIAANITESDNNVHGLVLEAAIFDVQSLVKGMAPSWKTVEVDPELQGLSNEKYITNYQGPLFFIVGAKDTITPSISTQKLYDISPSNQKKLLVIDGASHVNSMTFDQTFTEYLAFLKSIN
jgi:pimeloyl-ACP methyl ester carboxylesterase